MVYFLFGTVSQTIVNPILKSRKLLDDRTNRTSVGQTRFPHTRVYVHTRKIRLYVNAVRAKNSHIYARVSHVVFRAVLKGVGVGGGLEKRVRAQCIYYYCYYTVRVRVYDVRKRGGHVQDVVVVFNNDVRVSYIYIRYIVDTYESNI